MGYETVYANFKADEGTLNGTLTITFELKTRQITIANDSATDNLSFKLNASETFGTVLPGERVQLEVITRELLLSTGASVAYRIWSFG
tara:strand:+ start:14520 stop:14783 length:264 start_codon:yes stop_codon:yes gene_type:complete